MFNVPVEGYEVWGFQFLDERSVLVSLTSKRKGPGSREKLKHHLRILSLKLSPEFKVNPDPRLNFFVNLPAVKTENIQRVLLIRNISPIESIPFRRHTLDNPDRRLIGLRYQFTDVGYQTKDIIVLVNFKELLARRESAKFLKMNLRKLPASTSYSPGTDWSGYPGPAHLQLFSFAIIIQKLRKHAHNIWKEGPRHSRIREPSMENENVPPF
ncbi:hypothetical protein BDQ17DRAFT_763457 [Cyathus striatus]|nr:hypothetical protein BDQ17DRAFT_763457 [Cyathus striatus]